MNTFEVERRETISRDEAATRLRRIANLLSGDDDEVKFERDQMQFKVAIPEQVQWKVELELGDDENELEIELKW
jgi:amphi-Trp domain-containing protein